jgi:3-oxoacyl-[acyl-carrier protein] reductase
MDLGLAGKRALVTGGTRGIGRAIAFALAHEGTGVGICARHEGAVEETVTALAATGVKAWGQAVDVADAKALTRWVETGAEALGGLDILVTNASAFAAGASPAEFRRAFDVDLMHTIVAAAAAMPHMDRAGGGSIIAISSVSGSEDYGYDDAAYGTMKAALNFYVKSLSRAAAEKNIRANTVSPGTTYFKGGFWHKVEVEQPQVFQATLASNPTGRLASAEEIANVVVFVASGRAGFVSGANIVVDGALTRRVQY